jgi:haloacetate dehalogenase
MFDPALLAEYRRCWNDPEMIRGSCEDYRAALTIDYEHDRADLHRTVDCPTLALWGERGLMACRYDIAAAWHARCTDLATASVDGGHFFVDEQPARTAELLSNFLHCQE